MSPLIAIVSVSTLIDLAVKSLVVMLVSCAAAAALYRASAARRHLVWTLGIAAVLALPLMSLVLPAWRASWLPQWTARADSIADRAVKQSMASVAVTNKSPAQEAAVPLADAVPTSGVPDTSGTDASAAMVAIDQTPAGWSWPAIVIAGWLSGLVLALTPLAVGLWQLRRLPAQDRRG